MAARIPAEGRVTVSERKSITSSSLLLEVCGAVLVQLLVRVAHQVRPGHADHDLEIHRLEAVVDIAVDHARRTGDAFPGSEPDVDAPPVLVLDERVQVALQDEEDLLDLVGMRRVALARLDIHDAQRERPRRNHTRVADLARAAGADEPVLGALVAFDPRIGERIPVGLAVAKPGNVLLRDLVQGQCRDLRRHRMSSCGSGGHSGFTPAVLTTCVQRATSLRTCAPSSSGVLPTGVVPRPLRRAFRSGIARALAMSVLSLFVTSAGIPAGPKMAYHEVTRNPG